MNKSNHLGNPWLHILTKVTLSVHDSGSKRMDLSTSQKTRHWSVADPWESLVILRVLDQTGEGTSAFGWFGFLGFCTDIHTEPSTWEPPRPGLMLSSGCLEMLNHLPLTLCSEVDMPIHLFCCSCEYSDHHVHEHRISMDSWCVWGQRDSKWSQDHCASSLI